MTIVYGGFSLFSSASKYPRSTQRSYSGPSTSAGAYWVGSSVGLLFGPPSRGLC